MVFKGTGLMRICAAKATDRLGHADDVPIKPDNPYQALYVGASMPDRATLIKQHWRTVSSQNMQLLFKPCVILRVSEQACRTIKSMIYGSLMHERS